MYIFLNQMDSSLSNFNSLVSPMLTDLYQLTMAYAYWKNGKANETCSFELFIRNAPFDGEYVVFAGLHECLALVNNFTFSQNDIDYLKTIMPSYVENEFFQYLLNIKDETKKLTIRALPEGTVCGPKLPFIMIDGPLLLVQLLETPFLNLVNYATLIATNASRYCNVVNRDSDNILMFEFGARRAQGPDGALSASKYSYIGGFDGTSNVLAGKLFGIPVLGTHAHSFIMSFYNENKNTTKLILKIDDVVVSDDFMEIVEKCRDKILKVFPSNINADELFAFANFATAFPSKFLALIDTYDVLKSGVVNFAIVSMALNTFGLRGFGVRIDSGDLAYLSLKVSEYLTKIADTFEIPHLKTVAIVASNDISEKVLESIQSQPNSINAYGIGTNLVTCQGQPALGAVFKLVEIEKHPKIKLSESPSKITIPAKKMCYRLFSSKGHPIVDLMTLADEPEPKVGEEILCRHPFNESMMVKALPSKVEILHKLYWDGKLTEKSFPSVGEIRYFVKSNLLDFRQDHLRIHNPTPYKVSVSNKLYSLTHELWFTNTSKSVMS